MLRKILFRSLVVAALLVVVALPAAAFTPSQTGPWCQANATGANPKAVVMENQCWWYTSSITFQPDSVPAGATATEVDLFAKFRYAHTNSLGVVLQSPNGNWTWLGPFSGKLAGDMTYTYSVHLPQDGQNGFVGSQVVPGCWTLWFYDCGDQDPAKPQLDYWSLEVDYTYPCTSISGVVLNQADNSPMAGVEVQFYRHVIGGPVPGSWIAKTATGADGKFFISRGGLNDAALEYWVAIVPPAGYVAARVQCPLEWEAGYNAIRVPWAAGNFSGAQFFLKTAPTPPDKPNGIFGAAADTWIGESAKATAKHGAEGSLRIRTGGAEASLLMFDVSSIPTGATVSKATLVLTANYRSNPNAMKVGAFKVLRSWTEDATWTKTGSGDWAAAGAFDATDRELTPVGTGKVGKAGSAITIDVTDMVKAWVADPTSNLGVYLAGISDSSTEVSVDSSESIYEAARPVLQVVYS